MDGVFQEQYAQRTIIELCMLRQHDQCSHSVRHSRELEPHSLFEGGIRWYSGLAFDTAGSVVRQGWYSRIEYPLRYP